MKNLFSPASGLLLALALALGGCVGQEPAPDLSPVPEVRPGILAGYLPTESLPDSLALIPPPPAKGSPAQALDRKITTRSLELQGSPRWGLAARDADLIFPKAASIFACALGTDISKDRMPHLYRLLRRTLADAGLSTYRAKKYYARKRPFMINGKPVCTPREEEHLRKDGSYPSGHAAIGWAWALILAELVPDRTNQLLARGLAFGQSRVICNVHWQSDVLMGRAMGAAAVARLHSDKEFLAAMQAARKELEDAAGKASPSSSDCAAEEKALEEYPSGIPWPARQAKVTDASQASAKNR